LHHPHILPLFDSGEAGGFLYCVLPHIAGDTLRDRLEREGPLPLSDALEVTAHIAAALGYAHRHGVVHRDVKPDNILLHAGGALLADFDTAIAVRDDADGSDAGVGTPTYMSPEQITGREAVTGRSDLYALACVLYEMMTGFPPFTAATAESLVARQVEDDPTPVNALRPEVSPGLARVVHKALAKAPADRFDNLEAFAAALVAPADGLPEATVKSVAVLPFDDGGLGSDLSYLADGLTVDVLRELSRVRALRLVGRESAFAVAQQERDVPTIGRRLGVDVVVVGELELVEGDIRARSRLVSVSDGSDLWSGGFDRERESVADLRQVIPAAIAAALRLRIGDEEARGDPRSVPAVDRRAYLHYLRGQYHLNKFTPSDLMQAMACFEEAIDRDPDFAPAYAAIAEIYLILGGPTGAQAMPPAEFQSRTSAAIEKALALDDRMPDAHAVRGMLRMCTDWDWQGADEAFSRALELGPGSAQTHVLHAWYLICAGRLEEALDAAYTAEELDPLSLVVGHVLATVLIHMGRIEAAIAEFDRLSNSDPSGALGVLGLFVTHAARGDFDRAAEYVERLQGAVGADEPIALYAKGCLCALRQDRKGAARVVARLTDLQGTRYVPPMYSAWIHICLGDLDVAFEQMEQAFASRDPLLVTVRTWPWGCFDTMRADARWTDLSGRLGIA
jgi:serine/threonine-protein kinase